MYSGINLEYIRGPKWKKSLSNFGFRSPTMFPKTCRKENIDKADWYKYQLKAMTTELK